MTSIASIENEIHVRNNVYQTEFKLVLGWVSLVGKGGTPNPFNQSCGSYGVHGVWNAL
jgi:hypothetical protein